MFNPVAPYEYLLSNRYLFIADIANPDSFVYCCRTWISLDITRFYEEQRQPYSCSAYPASQKKKLAPIAGGGRVRHNSHNSL